MAMSSNPVIHESIRPDFIPSKYHIAIRKRLDQQQIIHTERGRAITLGGDIYYSPNSSYVPSLPCNDGKPFLRNASQDNVDELQKPLWWVKEMAYLAFIPQLPKFHIVPFHQLSSNPMTVKSSKGAFIQKANPHDIMNWKLTEQRMQDIFECFQSAYGIPKMDYVVSTSVAFAAEYKYSSRYKSDEKRCCNWFAVWMGLVSFAIAVAQTYDNEDYTTPYPQWMFSLLRFYDAPVAAGVRQELALFSDHYPRAGVFLKIMGETFQHPAIDFFVRWNIPIWYPWGDREEYHLRCNPAGWSSWKPPAHLLQKAKSFLVKAPSSLQTNSHSSSVSEPAWKLFIAKRQSRQMEKSGAKPVKMPKKVFVWEKEDGEWKRVAVHKNDHEETLQEFGEAQKYYDKLTNEWDCCEAMGQKTAEELQRETWSDEDDLMPNMVPISATALPSNSGVENASSLVVSEEHVCPPQSVIYGPSFDISTPERGPTHLHESLLQRDNAANNHKGLGSSYSSRAETSLAQSVQLRCPDEECQPETYSPENILYLLYGFTCPTSRSNLRLPQYTVETEANIVRHVCGTPSVADSYFNSATGQAAIDFVKYLLQADSSPRNELYDLSCSNNKYIKKLWRLNSIQRLPGDLYVFKPGGGAIAPWLLAVKGSISALLVVRLDQDWDEYRLAYELLNRGMQFFTLKSVSSDSPTNSNVTPYIPRTRMFSYKFSRDDYELYKQERANLICNPRIGRAALKEGGIIWRLSVELNVSYSQVLDGPMTSATLTRICQAFNSGQPQIRVDDYLHDSEKDIICGVYKVNTGRGRQQSVSSWWPTASLWEELVTFPIWNDYLECIYQDRLKELESGCAKPRTASDWRKVLRAHSLVRRAINNSAKKASVILASASKS